MARQGFHQLSSLVIILVSLKKIHEGKYSASFLPPALEVEKARASA